MTTWSELAAIENARMWESVRGRKRSPYLPNQKPTGTRDQKIKQMHEGGMTYREIAERMQCSMAAVVRVVNP